MVRILLDRIIERGLKVPRGAVSAISDRAVARGSSRWTPLVVAAVTIAACTSDNDGRVAATTLMGGALGIPAGPIGIAVGAGVGAVAGTVAPKEVFEGSSESDRH